MEELIKKLQYAKKAVIASINNEATSVDFHGLIYWTEEVERLRSEIKKQL